MDRKIQSHKFNELWVIISQHLGEVVTPVLRRVNGSNTASVLERVAVNRRSNDWKFGNQIHAVLVYILTETARVSFESQTKLMHVPPSISTCLPHLSTPLRIYFHC